MERNERIHTGGAGTSRGTGDAGTGMCILAAIGIGEMLRAEDSLVRGDDSGVGTGLDVAVGSQFAAADGTAGAGSGAGGGGV